MMSLLGFEGKSHNCYLPTPQGGHCWMNEYSGKAEQIY